jgi:hypothetical protein
MIIRNERPQRAGDEQLQLMPFLAPQASRIPTDHDALRSRESEPSDFFNCPMVHFTVFSHVAAGKLREVALMLKAIHARRTLLPFGAKRAKSLLGSTA